MNLTNRESWVLAQALHVATRHLMSLDHPPLSNIDDMELLLDKFFAGFREVFVLQDMLPTAISRGMHLTADTFYTPETSMAWLENNQ